MERISRINATRYDFDIASLRNEVNEMKKQPQGNSDNQHHRKKASESKAISCLKTLKDKRDFKQWHDKLTNGISQVYPKARDVMQKMRRRLDEKRQGVGRDDWEEFTNIESGVAHDKDKPAWSQEEFNTFNNDLHYILVEKTEDETSRRVQEVDSGDRMSAYQRLYLWFSSVSGQALNDRARKVMSPNSPNKPEDVAEAVGKWLG